MALRIDALGMEWVGMLRARARRTRSVCVVALGGLACFFEDVIPGRRISWAMRREGEGVPERIPYDEEGNVLFVGAG